jgi:DNA invertase Pin-like site-specific DNA recombinase
MGLEIDVDLADNGKSGTIPLFERPQGSQLKELIDAGEVKHVIAMKIDRMFRDVMDALKTVDYLTSKGVALHFCDMGGATLVTSTAMGRFMFTNLAAIAEFESRVISERTTAALAVKKANGEPVGRRREINDEMVEQIKKLRFDDLTHQEIADSLGISASSVSKILLGRK